jgi:hypothetical protein
MAELGLGVVVQVAMEIQKIEGAPPFAFLLILIYFR